MLWWLSLFLFAVQWLEDTVNQAAAHKLKKRIRASTNTNLKALCSGFITTVILQSSSVVSLMILAFVWAGAIALNHGVAAIIGANIGTTVIDVVIAYVWFNFNISGFAMPMVAIGWLLRAFLGRYKRATVFGQIIFFVWLIFIGIGYMKESVDFVSKTIDLKQYMTRWPWWFYILGIILTAIMHSSGAMTIVAISAFTSWIIDFNTTIIILLGANVGTTVTATLGALGKSSLKKQIAASHVIFNFVTSTVAMFFVPSITYWLDIVFGLPQQSIFALSRFQFIYNVLCGLIFFPINDYYTKFLMRIIPQSKSDYTLLSDEVNEVQSPVFANAVGKDAVMLLKKIYKFNVHQFQIDQKILLDDAIPLWQKYSSEYIVSPQWLEEDYDLLKEIESKLTQILINTPKADHVDTLKNLHNSIIDMIYAAKTLKDIKPNIDLCLSSSNQIVKDHIGLVKKAMIDMYIPLSEIIDQQDVSHNITKLKELTHMLTTNNDNMISNFATLSQQAIDPEELSSIIHINQWFETSMQMILKAVNSLLQSIH